MGKLNNLRHEAVVQNLANPAKDTFLNQTKAYRSVYPDANGSARGSAAELLANPSVKDRFLELMDKVGLDDASIAKRHADILHNGEESNALKAIIHANALKGRAVNARNSEMGTVAMQININIGNVEPTPNSNDTKDLGEQNSS